jgi:hypothetical protein
MTNCMEQDPSSEAGSGPDSQEIESLPGNRLYCIIASVAFFPPSGEH